MNLISLQTGDNRRVYAWRIMYVTRPTFGHEGAKECVPVIGPFVFFFSSLFTPSNLPPIPSRCS